MGGLLISLVTRTAHAKGVFDLQVERSPSAQSCPDEAAVVARVESILGRSLATLRPTADGVAISVRFHHAGEGYSASVRFYGAKAGERRLHDAGRTCDALADAVSITVALVMEGKSEPAPDDRQLPDTASPTSGGRASAPAPGVPAPGVQASAPAPGVQASAPTPGVPAPAPGVPALAPGVQAPAPVLGVEAPVPPSNDAAPGAPGLFSAWTASASLAGGPAWGFAADSSWHLGGQLHVRTPTRIELGFGLHHVFERQVDTPPAAVRTSLWLASLQACYVWGQRVSFAPCATYGVGVLRGEGAGYAENRTTELLWSALGAGLLIRAALSNSLFLSLSGSSWIPLRSLTFSAQNAGVVLRVPSISGTLGLGLGVNWGG